MAKFEFVVRNRYQWFVIKEHLDIWIHTLLHKHVQELVFILSYEPTEIPSCLFSMLDLKLLDLRGCKINVPKYIDDFKKLHTLKLENFQLIGIDIESLISKCPLLTDFMLHTQYQEFSNLTIRSPNLLELKIYAKFEELHLETPKLVTLIASLYENSRDVSEIQSKYKNNTNRFMCCLPQIQKLDISWNFVRYLASGGVPEQFSINFNYLTDLAIAIDCACNEHIDLVVCLLQCAPKLRSFHIQFNSEEFIDPSYPSNWESTEATSCWLHQLQKVKVGGQFPDSKCIVAFIKFVLRRAPILEELEPEKSSFNSMIDRKKFLLQLLELPRLPKQGHH